MNRAGQCFLFGRQNPFTNHAALAAHVQEREKEIEVHTEANKFRPETSDKVRQLAWKFIAGEHHWLMLESWIIYISGRVFTGVCEVLRAQIRAAEEEKHKASHLFEAADGCIPPRVETCLTLDACSWYVLVHGGDCYIYIYVCVYIYIGLAVGCQGLVNVPHWGFQVFVQMGLFEHYGYLE